MYIGAKFLFRIILFFAFTWIFLHCLLPFLLPFLLGLGLAWAAEPAVRLLRGRLKLPRLLASGISVTCCFLLLVLAFLSLLALLIRGLAPLTEILPDLAETASSGLELLKSWLLSLSDRGPQSLRPVLRGQILELFSDSTAFLGQGLKYGLSLAGGILTHIPDRALTLFTALISGYMFSVRLPKLKDWFLELISRPRLQALCELFRGLRSTLGGWLLAQVKLFLTAFFILSAGFFLLRIPYAPLWALGTAFLDALPLLGTGIVLLPWSLIFFLQGSSVKALGMLALYVTAALSRSLLEPRFVGKQLGLDPLLTLAAIYIGYRLWGFPGMILSPLLAVTGLSLLPRQEGPDKSS